MANRAEFLEAYKRVLKESLISYIDGASIDSITNYLDWNNDIAGSFDDRLLKLEQNETVYQIYQYVGKSTSGSITIPTEATIFDVYGDGILDAIVVEADANNNPTEENSLNSLGQIVQVTSLSNLGAYVLSSTPLENSCILFFIKIKDQYKENVLTDSIIPPAIRLDPDLQQAYNNSQIPQIILSNLLGAFTIQSETNDGSTLITKLLDSDGNVVEYTDSEGFHQIRYRDEYANGDWVNSGGGAAPDIVTHTVGGVTKNYSCYDGGNTEESKGNQFEMAHDVAYTAVNAGTVKLEVHAHIRPSTNTAGVARFYMDWSYSPANSAPLAQGSLPIDFIINSNELYFHKLAGVELPIPVGGYSLGGMIDFRFRRTPTDPIDTYPDDILFLQFAMHVPIDGGGSRQRYVK